VWSHSLEFGYWKHPPLPTWLLAALIRGVGFSAYWTYVLAAACFAGTAFFTWRIGCKIFNNYVGILAVLFVSLHMGFSLRAELYNHNTVLLLFTSAAVYTTLLAIETKRKLEWLMTGVLAGLALLSKYQALVPLLGILMALYLGGWFKKKDVRHGVVLAAITALIVFSPHLIWMITGDGTTIDNALHAAENLSPLRRIVALTGFWLIQFRFHLPILVAIAFLILHKTSTHLKTEVIVNLDQQQRAWFLGLVGWPALVVSMAVVLGGVKLQAQWGLQSLQFLVIFMAWRCSLVIPQLERKKVIQVVVVSHMIFAVFLMWSILQPSNVIWKGKRDRNFPAQTTTKILMEQWRSVTKCRLRYVVGDVLEAASVSVYSGQNPAVLEGGSFQKSPWINPGQLKINGGIYLARNSSDLPAESAVRGEIVIPGNKNDMQQERTLYWGINSPQFSCKY
jgi:4-amino-4-deoxy-L-arabinose transferase-like glycosyltransferase